MAEDMPLFTLPTSVFWPHLLTIISQLIQLVYGAPNALQKFISHCIHRRALGKPMAADAGFNEGEISHLTFQTSRLT